MMVVLLHQLLSETGRRYPLRMIQARVATSAMVRLGHQVVYHEAT